MGLFGKKSKGDALHNEKPPRVVSITQENYQPPQLSPVTQLFVEVDDDSKLQALPAVVSPPAQYSKSQDEFVNAEKTMGEDAQAILSISSIDGPSATPAAPKPAQETPQQKMPYQPIRYESAKPPDILKAPVLPEIERSFPVSPTSLTTTPPLSPRAHYRCMPSSNRSQTGGPCLPALQHKAEEVKSNETIPVSPGSTATPKAATSATCGCLELNGGCGTGNTYETADADDGIAAESPAPQPLPQRGVLSTFSDRFTSFSHHFSSFRHKAKEPLHSYDEAEPPILLNNPTKDEDNLTVSTGGTKDTLFSFSKLSWDGSATLMPANQDVQAQILTWKRGAVIGTPMIRFSAILAAFVAIVATIFLMALEEFFWTISNVVCAVHTILAGMLIMILEVHHGKEEEEPACPQEANHFRDRLRSLIVRNLNMMRMVWGRGALYMYTGSMALTIEHFSVFLPGVLLIFIGIVAIAKGVYASSKLETLKLSFSDETLLREKFVQADRDFLKTINAKQFHFLVWSLGLELSAERAKELFDDIGADHKGRITYKQFKDWWLKEPSLGTHNDKGRQSPNKSYVLAKPEPKARHQMTGRHRLSQNRFHTATLDAVV